MAAPKVTCYTMIPFRPMLKNWQVHIHKQDSGFCWWQIGKKLDTFSVRCDVRCKMFYEWAEPQTVFGYQTTKKGNGWTNEVKL